MKRENNEPKKNRSYTTEEEEHIYSKIEEAKALKLEMKIVFQKMADDFGVTRGAMEQKYYGIRDKKKKKVGDAIVKQPVNPKSRAEMSVITIVDPPIDTMLVAIEKIVKDRDFYKAEYERLLAERRTMQLLLGV